MIPRSLPPPVDSASALSTAAWQRRLDALEAFEQAFQRGERPAIGHFLAVAPDEAERRALLVDLVHADLELRMKAGERVAVEAYLDRFPELRDDPAPALDLIEAEYRLRLRTEPALSVEEYLRRFPQWHSQLDERFPRPTVAEAPGRESPPPFATTSATAEQSSTDCAPRHDPSGPLRRYQWLDPVGRGGMAEVWRVRDLDLGRTLAVKVLRERLRGQPDFVRRFREEARITGQLQHPGIPPVHEVGTLPDGRPFFAMKLIKGRTLDELLRERPVPTSELSRFLGIFEQVAQTLAYAHSRGVIHRDLKPLNVMVGAFGEVQVMDWGLAKVLRQPERAATVSQDATMAAGPDGATIINPRGADTTAGSVLGTPAYMAPEQARGEVDSLDERCDVFGLGAILCEILTGQPPYTLDNAFRQAEQGDVTAALDRLQACPADAELVHLARSCLAPLAAQRPRDAGQAARRIGSYQALVQERLRTAEVEQARVEVKVREERKRRSLAVTLAATLLVLLLASIGGLLKVIAEQKRADQARLQEQDSREAAERAHEQERSARQRTRESLDDVTSGLLERFLTRDHRNLDKSQQTFLKRLLEHYRTFAAEQGDDEPTLAGVAEAHLRLAQLYHKLGQLKDAETCCRESVQRYEKLAATGSDSAPYRKPLARAWTFLGSLLGWDNRLDESAAAFREALRLLPEAKANDSDTDAVLDVAQARVGIAAIYVNSGKREQAEPILRAAIALLQQHQASGQGAIRLRRTLAHAHRVLTIVLVHWKPRRAGAVLRETIRLYEELHREALDEPQYRFDLAGSLIQAVRLDALMNEDRTATARNGQRAVELLAGLTHDFPAVPEYRSELATAYYVQASAAVRRGNWPEAAEHLRNAVAVSRHLLATFPLSVYRYELAFNLRELGMVQRNLKHRDETEQAYREAVHLFQESGNNRSMKHALGLTGAAAGLGTVYLTTRRPAEALRCFELARQALEPLRGPDEPINVRVYRYQVLMGIGHANHLLGRCAAAVTCFDQAANIVGAHGMDVNFLSNRALALSGCRQFARAVEDAEAVVADSGASPGSLYNVAQVFAEASAASSADRTRLEQRALELLRKIEKAGYFKDAERREAVGRSTTFLALRTHPEFLRLLREIDTTAASGSAPKRQR